MNIRALVYKFICTWQMINYLKYLKCSFFIILEISIKVLTCEDLEPFKLCSASGKQGDQCVFTFFLCYQRLLCTFIKLPIITGRFMLSKALLTHSATSANVACCMYPVAVKLQALFHPFFPQTTKQTSVGGTIH